MASTNPFRQPPNPEFQTHYLTSNPNNPFAHPADLDEDAAIAWQLQYDLENEPARPRAPVDETENDRLIAESLQEHEVHAREPSQANEDIENDRLFAERLQRELEISSSSTQTFQNSPAQLPAVSSSSVSDHTRQNFENDRLYAQRLQQELSTNRRSPSRDSRRQPLSQSPPLSTNTRLRQVDQNIENDRLLAERLQLEFLGQDGESSSSEPVIYSQTASSPSSNLGEPLDDEEPPAYSPFVKNGEQVLEQGPNRPFQGTSSSATPGTTYTMPSPQPPVPVSASDPPYSQTSHSSRASVPGSFSSHANLSNSSTNRILPPSPEHPCPQCGNVGNNSTLLGIRVPGVNACPTCWKGFGLGVAGSLKSNTGRQPNSMHSTSNGLIYSPGDPRIGGSACTKCGGTGATLFGSCSKCYGTGRVMHN